MNWFTGGLNHQIEHHIFPHISHIHYTDIAKIVKKTAKEFNLPYNEYKTTRSALFSHFQISKNKWGFNLHKLVIKWKNYQKELTAYLFQQH